MQPCRQGLLSLRRSWSRRLMTKSKFVSMTNQQRRKAFAEEFRRALDRNNATASSLAQQLSLSYHRVHHWYSGRSLPSYQTVTLIAGFLGDDELERAGIALNQRTCANCGVEYLQQSPQGRSFLCSKKCRQENERVRTKSGKSSVARTKYTAVDVYLSSLEKFCRGCEPGGVCKNSDCALRPVSPLPLFSKAQAVMSSGGREIAKENPATRANK